MVLFTARLLNEWPSTTGIQFDDRMPAPRIVRVPADSPAAAAGLLPGDLIVAIDGVTIEGLNWAGVIYLLDSHKVGTEVSITVSRGAGLKTFTVKTQPRRYQ